MLDNEQIELSYYVTKIPLIQDDFTETSEQIKRANICFHELVRRS